MITLTSFGGTIWPKWMQKPWAKSTVMPGFRAGLTTESQTSRWMWSGTKRPTTSASWTASWGVTGVTPWLSARFQPSEPGRRPTVTSAPESRSDSAWAWPCEP